MVRDQGSVRVSDVAAQIGVSEVTVRRDVNALDRQGLVTRVHGGAITRPVTERARERPPAQHVLGVVIPSMDYYWPTIVNGVQTCAAVNRAQLVLRASSYALEDDRQQVMALLTTGHADALLVAPLLTAYEADGMLAWLEGLDIPVVLMERSVPSGFYSARLEWVTTDQFHAAALAVREFAAQGHRRIGLLTNLGTPHRAAAIEGWARACESLGLVTRGVVCEDAPRAISRDRDALLDGIVERCLATRTTAVLVHSDPEAIALVQRATDLGLDVPGDLAVIAHDDEIAALSSPPLSAIRPPKREIGITAANLALRRLTEPDWPLNHVVLCPELVRRQSSGPHRAGK